tara:strand:+ start:6670 stop:6858 length:189 start_codon:yes stop_codon:yes gene_type:complete
MDIINYVLGSVFIIGAGWFAYMSFHVGEENRKNKYIPLPWEKGGIFRPFDKSDVKYRDGDNT